MIHLAGYATDGDRAHPEMYFVRNFRGSSPLGYYDEPGAEFFVSEEFWSRDYRSEQNRETVASGGAHLYLNGSPKTRIAYLVLNQRLHDFYRQTWAASKRFRSPRTLQELATLIEIDMRLTSAFLGSIGKKVNADPAQIEMELIPAPSGALQL
jgi:hypothetical protein